jgi:hypothetical protein
LDAVLANSSSNDAMDSAPAIVAIRANVALGLMWAKWDGEYLNQSLARGRLYTGLRTSRGGYLPHSLADSGGWSGPLNPVG